MRMQDERKRRLTTPTADGDMPMSIRVCVGRSYYSQLTKEKKGRKKNLYCCFVRRVDTREKRQRSGNTFSLVLFSSHLSLYIFILLLHRNVDDDSDAIM